MAYLCFKKIEENCAEEAQEMDIPHYSEETTELYIGWICKYANKVRNVGENGSCSFLPSSYVKTLDKKPPKTEEEVPSTEDFENLDMDYIFAPTLNESEKPCHYGLMGIAPKQQFVFVVDSIVYDPRTFGSRPRSKFATERMYNPVLGLLPDDLGKSKKDFKANWNVFGHWARKNVPKLEGTPSCATQKDFVSCGIFTMTNAMCLAFGYDMLCYQEDDLAGFKRPRIVGELENEGFSGDYAYDLRDLPTGKADRVGTEPPAKETPSPDSPIEETVHAIPNLRKRKYISRPNGMGGSGIIRSAAEALAYEQLLPEELKSKPRVAEPYPVQFDSKVFSHAGFLYEVPESINYNLKKEYSLEELKAACQNFSLEGWQEWSARPKEKFMR